MSWPKTLYLTPDDWSSEDNFILTSDQLEQALRDLEGLGWDVAEDDTTPLEFVASLEGRALYRGRGIEVIITRDGDAYIPAR